MNRRLAVALLGVIAIVSLVFNAVLWKSVRNERDVYNTLVYEQLAMNLRSELHTAAGYTLAPEPQYAFSAMFIHGAINDLQQLNKPFTQQGILFVQDIIIRLSSVQDDFVNNQNVSAKTLSSDRQYIQQVYNIIESKCYPKGHILKAALPEAFAEIHSLPQ